MQIIKSFTATTAIPHRRQVKFATNDGEIALATAATDLVVGVSDCPGGAAIGERVDIVMLGETELDMGGTVAAGAFFTADANGKGVACAPATGANARAGGIMMMGAVSGDIARVLVTPSRPQG